MKSLERCLLCLAALLSGCDGLSEVGRAAESVRTSAERMASRNRTATDARAARIIEQAIEIERQTASQNPEQARQSARYEVRRDGGAWAVYDISTGRPAKVGIKPQSGLTLGQAEEAAYELQNQENAERLRAAAFGAGPHITR